MWPPTLHFSKKLPEWVAPLFLGSCSFIAYLSTLPTVFSFEDSAEYVTATSVLGIAHPSGYPLYVLVGHLFTLLPFGTIPWRVALFSAVCAALALSALYAVARKLVATVDGRVDAVTELLMVSVFGVLAFSPLWWSQAVYAKVYALHVLLLGLVLLHLLRLAERKKESDLFLASFFFGLACANHLFLTLVVGPWFCAAVATALWRKWRWQQAVLMVAGGTLGLLPYLYIALRMPTAPYATVPFDHLGQLLKFILRSNYADVGTGGGDKVALFASLCRRAFEDIGPIATVLACFGVHIAVRRAAASTVRVSVLFGAGVLAAIVSLIGFRSIGFSDESAYLYRVYGLPGEAFAVLFAAVGAVSVLRADVFQRHRAFRVAFVLLLIALPVFSVGRSVPLVRITTHPFVESWLRDTLESLPPDAVFVVADGGEVTDTELFGLSYLQTVAGMRRDVTVVTDTVIRPLYRPALPERESRFSLNLRRRMLLEAAMDDGSLKGRPILTSFSPEAVSPAFRSRATGYAFALDTHAPLPQAPHFLLPSDADTSRAAQLIAAHLGYLEASRLNESAGAKAAGPILQSAMRFDPDPVSGDYLGFVHHRAATSGVER